MAHRTPTEAALRYLGTRTYGQLVDVLELAIARPHSSAGRVLAPLTSPVAGLDEWPVRERAVAVWRVVQEGIESRSVSPTPSSRKRHALCAAFRLPVDGIEEWGASLTDRFKQLRELPIFGMPTSTQPMEMAWKRGAERLADVLDERFATIRHSADWEPYRAPRNAARAVAQSADDTGEFRKPSPGAQPLVADLFVTTVFMRGRSVHRRITERIVTAQVDGLGYYTAHGYAIVDKSHQHVDVPVRALWGCRAEPVRPTSGGQPPETRLRFPAPLRKGEKAHFASETVPSEIVADERHWLDVDIDHHGIPRGKTLYDGRLPTRGLTIRVVFDAGHVPEAAWWYAELTERERYDQPPGGDPHLLDIIDGEIRKTFTEQSCQPREHYGVAFRWPHR